MLSKSIGYLPHSSSDLAALGHLPPGGRVLALIWTLSVQFDAILGVSPQFLTNMFTFIIPKVKMKKE